jgi:diguanylate cyclase (GGDEF)-like protein
VTSTSKQALFIVAFVAAACTLVDAGSGLALVARLAMAGTVGWSIWLGVRTYKPARSLSSHLAHPDPWILLGVGLCLGAVIDVVRTLGGNSSTVIHSFVILALMALATLTGFALVGMLRQRFGDRALDHCFEALVTAGTISMVLWVAVVEPALRDADQTARQGVWTAVGLTVTLSLCALSMHLVTSFDKRLPAFTSLATGLTISVLTVLLAFLGAHEGPNVFNAVAAALPALALAFIGLGALEPSMALYEEPSGPAGARLSKWRLANLIVPVVLGPTLLTLGLTHTMTRSPLAIATFTIGLSLLVVGHLIAMVQARASSTHWASHDKLTGLPNRALFRERTAQALERARKMGHGVAIMYLDLDRFKHINDSMGHQAGDELLEQVAKRVLTCVDPGDTVARLGGDEFAILLPAVDDDRVPRQLARRILKTFSSPFNLRPRPVFMSPSVGIAVSEGSVSLETLLTQADTAMYRAKESGRNNFAVWSQEMNEASKQRLMLETHLHSAITNNELRLVYQPKVELATGNIVGVEALLRWHHPKLGIISPAVFIHLAEESGLINQIGEWVLYTACDQARRWADAGYQNLTVAVNLSSRQFQQQKIADLVSRILRATRLSPELLELELTESLAMSGEGGTAETLHELRQMGVQCSIDDFGTGYSNLSYLSRFPIDTLKIDKSFIEQIDKSGGDAAIVVAIIAMAHGLGLKVIAEGVETPEQATFLAKNECDEMQGFLYSKPLPPHELEGLLMLERAKGNAAYVKPAGRATRRLEREMPETERYASSLSPSPSPEPATPPGPRPYDPFDEYADENN